MKNVKLNPAKTLRPSTWRRYAEVLQVVAALAIVPGAVLACKGGSGSSGSSSSSGSAAKIGETVKLDESQYIVVEAKDLGKDLKANDEFTEAKKTTGRFIQVKYKITNTGKKPQGLLEDPKIVDDKGREFGGVEMESAYVPKGGKVPLLDTLQPSMEREYYSIVEVPADATKLKLQVHDLGILGEKKTVDLGL